MRACLQVRTSVCVCTCVVPRAGGAETGSTTTLPPFRLSLCVRLVADNSLSKMGVAPVHACVRVRTHVCVCVCVIMHMVLIPTHTHIHTHAHNALAGRGFVASTACARSFDCVGVWAYVWVCVGVWMTIIFKQRHIFNLTHPHTYLWVVPAGLW